MSDEQNGLKDVAPWVGQADAKSSGPVPSDAEYIAKLEAEVADERTRTELYKRHRDKAEAQGAAMRKALEDRILYRDALANWACEFCGAYETGDGERSSINHGELCPLSSDAGKDILAELDALRNENTLVKASAEGAASLLLDVQSECVGLRQGCTAIWLTEEDDGTFHCYCCDESAPTLGELKHGISQVEGVDGPCPLHSEAGKHMLAVLEAAEELDEILKKALANRELEPGDNVMWAPMQPLRKLHNTLTALKEVK